MCCIKSWLKWGITSHQSECPSSKNPQTVNAGKVVVKRELSCTVGGNVNWYSHYGEQYGDSFKKLGVTLPYDPAIPLLGNYPEKTIIQKDTCTPVFIAALFIVIRTWSNLDVHQQINALRSCGTYIQWNITLP